MKTNKSFEQIRQYFAKKHTHHSDKREKINKKMEQLKHQLQTLETRLISLEEKCPKWIELLLRPTVMIIEKQLQELGWEREDRRLSPMGTNRRVPVFFVKKGSKSKQTDTTTDDDIYIVFRPGNLKEGQLLYETGEKINAYPRGSLGDLNGMNLVAKPLESIEEATTFLKKQIDEMQSPSTTIDTQTVKDTVDPQQPEDSKK
jgi:hypothetical protein